MTYGVDQGHPPADNQCCCVHPQNGRAGCESEPHISSVSLHFLVLHERNLSCGVCKTMCYRALDSAQTFPTAPGKEKETRNSVHQGEFQSTKTEKRFSGQKHGRMQTRLARQPNLTLFLSRQTWSPYPSKKFRHILSENVEDSASRETTHRCLTPQLHPEYTPSPTQTTQSPNSTMKSHVPTARSCSF